MHLLTKMPNEGKRGTDRKRLSIIIILFRADPIQGASDYFKRTENIAGVKVNLLPFLTFFLLTDSIGYAISKSNARCKALTPSSPILSILL